MAIFYWLFILLGFVCAAIVAFQLTRAVAFRFARNTRAPALVRRAAHIAAAVAAPPAIVAAGLFGINLGSALIATWDDAIASETARVVLYGVAGACGIIVIGVSLVLAMAVAGAVFIKVFIDHR